MFWLIVELKAKHGHLAGLGSLGSSYHPAPPSRVLAHRSLRTCRRPCPQHGNSRYSRCFKQIYHNTVSTTTCIGPFFFWLLGLHLCISMSIFQIPSFVNCCSCIRIHPAPSPSMPARAACWMRRPKANFISSKST